MNTISFSTALINFTLPTLSAARLRQFFKSITTGLAMATILTTAPAYANSVSRILELEPRPRNYVVYQNSLVYIDNGTLLRLDSLNGTAQKLLPYTFSASAEFAVFDDSLFIRHAGSLFRIDSLDGTMADVDIQASPSYEWFSAEGYPGFARSIYPHGKMAQYDGSLYFLAHATMPSCGHAGWTNVMFRIESALSNPRQMKFTSNDCGNLTEPQVLEGTEAGLLYSELLGDPRYPQTNFLQWEENPKVYEDDSADEGIHGSLRGDWYEAKYFDGHIFLGYIKPDSGNPPFHRETELVRLDPATSDKRVYEINPLTTDRGTGSVDIELSRSSPKHFAVANGVLYFQAAADGENFELYRMTSAQAEPEALLLNPNGPSGAKPLGQYLNRLWFAADTGAGLDIHYLADDGVSAVPLGVGAAIANSARYFTQFNDQLIFSATTAVPGPYGTWGPKTRWGTYVVSIDQPEPCNTKVCSCGNSGKPNKSPCRNELRPRLTLNNAQYAKRPGLVARPGTRINIRCDVTNDSQQSLDAIHIAINDQHGQRSRSKSRSIGVCKRTAVAPGQSVRCRRTIRARKGIHKYSCVSRAVTRSGSRLGARAHAMARIRR